VAIRAGHNDTTLLGIEAKFFVSRELGVGDTDIGNVICVQVVVVIAQNLRDGVYIELILGTGIDEREGEELGVRVVTLEERNIGDVRSTVDGEERTLLLQVGGQISDGLLSLVLITGEDEDAEGSVGRNLLFKLNEVGISQTGDHGRSESTAGSQANVRDVEQGRLGRVAGIPVEDVGLVGNSISASELARGLEGLDELIFLAIISRDSLASRNLAGVRTALRKQSGVLGVEIQQGLGNILALTLVGAQDRAVGKASLDSVNLPSHVESIVEGSVHTLTRLRAVSVTGVSTHEYTLVQSVLLGDTLSNGVNGVPFNTVPLNPVWLQNVLCGLLDLLGGSGLPGVPIGIGRGGDLNVQADHVVLTGDNHDGTGIGVDCAFGLQYISFMDFRLYCFFSFFTYLDIREVSADNTVHDTPDIGNGVLVVNLDTKLFTNKATSTLTAEEVLGADSLNNVGVNALQLHLNGVIGIGAIVLEAVDGPRTLDPSASLLNLINENALDLTLVNEGGKRITSIDETRAAGPATSAADTRAITLGVPEGNIVDLSGLISHDRALQTKVAQDLCGTRLDSISTASGGRHRTVVDVLDLVAPAGHTKGQQQAHWAGADDDNVIRLLHHVC